MRIFDTDLAAFGDYRAIADGFAWDVPERMNIAAEVFDRWSTDSRRIALYVERPDGRRDIWSYRELVRLAKRYANFLVSLGLERGDRISLVMPQGAELAALHLAVYSIGAVVLPMSALYGPDSYRPPTATSSGTRERGRSSWPSPTPTLSARSGPNCQTSRP
ncbi:MAG: AMP-binding protein [bacterium]|nr:AMP-binding protein [bacterium]